MKRKICFIFELLLKIATIIFAFWGVCLQARDDGGFIRSNTYLYFTIISNLETVIIFSVFVVLRIAENIKRETNHSQTAVYAQIYDYCGNDDYLQLRHYCLHRSRIMCICFQ